MTALYIIAFLIACIGIVLALGITPERVGEDMKRFFDKQQTMQDMAKEAQGKDWNDYLCLKEKDKELQKNRSERA